MKAYLCAAVLLVPLWGTTAAADPSCRQTAGEQRSRELVRQCMEVSPATHPPCNVGNPCPTITEEIKRGCGLLASGDAQRIPPFCRNLSQ